MIPGQVTIWTSRRVHVQPPAFRVSENRFMPDNMILRFYAGAGPDVHGRFLNEIQSWSDDELERSHNFIQWLFPLDKESKANSDAPVLDEDTIREFRSSPALRLHLQESFIRILKFYGLQLRATVPLSIVRGQNYAERATEWLTPNNHNHLRITRILKSLKLLGLKTNASAFYDCLSDICHEEFKRASPQISRDTFKYWESAASG